MKCHIMPLELKLKRDFVVAGGKASVKKNYALVLDNTGIGEAAGSVHYGATSAQIYTELIQIAEIINNQKLDIDRFILESLDNYCNPVICALSTAWHDWQGKLQKLSFADKFGLDGYANQPTSITVSIGDIEAIDGYITRGFKSLKIKMDTNDGNSDEIIETLIQYPDVKLRIDANGSWDYKSAVHIINKLRPERIELIEQPFNAESIEEWKQLREKYDIPIIMDESICDISDVERVSGYIDGINVKIQKSGRLETAIEAMKFARNNGLKVMIGCMIESSVGIAAAYALSSLADYIDLDGRLLIEDDPFTGLEYEKGILNILGKYGHGISLL